MFKLWSGLWRKSHLVTDWAVKWVVDKEELHNSLSSFSGEVGVRVHLPSVHDRHGTSRHRLGRLLHLDQAHSAVARDGEPVVVAEPGDLHPNHGGRLQHRGSRVDKHFLSVNEALELLWSPRHGTLCHSTEIVR